MERDAGADAPPSEPEPPPKRTDQGLDAVSAGLSTAASLIGLSMFVRVVTFITNVLIARLVGPTVYGLSQVQFQFMLAFIMQISKEGVRRATATVSLSKEDLQRKTESMRSVVNLTWGGLVVGALAALVISVLFCNIHQFGESSELSLALFQRATALYALSAVLEISAEPAFALIQARGQQHLRVSAEALATVARCAATVFFLQGHLKPLLALAAAQAVYGFVLSSLLSWWTLRSNSLSVMDVLPRAGASTQAFIDGPLFSLASAFCLQSVFRFSLSEGERAVLSFSSITEMMHKGEYALVNNLGSLGVRLILQPIEEAAGITFAKLYAGKWTEDSQAAAAMFLKVLIKVGLVLGIAVVAVGYNSAGLVIVTLYGSKWSNGEAPALLCDFCLLFGLLALNGVMEAFLSSTSSPAWLRKFLIWHAFISVIYLGSCFFVVPLVGIRGLFWANGVCMACRILFAWFISRSYLKGSRFSIFSCFPCSRFILASAAIFMFSELVAESGKFWVTIPAVGGGALLELGAILMFERKLVGDVRKLWRKEKIS